MLRNGARDNTLTVRFDRVILLRQDKVLVEHLYREVVHAIRLTHICILTW